jgi:hypothetical protein
MEKLSRDTLLSLEAYAGARPAWRARVIAHKQARRVALGEHVSLLFEDRLTVQYQVQEMLRIERLFEPAAIEAELDAYNPLVPDGGNLKATMLLEYADADQRRQALATLGGLEHRVQARVEGHAAITAVADEDLARSAGGKTSAVHFLRFEFPPAAIAALRAGAGLAFAIDDPRMPVQASLDEAARQALAADFD